MTTGTGQMWLPSCPTFKSMDVRVIYSKIWVHFKVVTLLMEYRRSGMVVFTKSYLKDIQTENLCKNQSVYGP